MKIIRKLILFIQNKLKKKEVKALEAPKEQNHEEKKLHFAESSRTMKVEEKNQKEVETLICTGDGLRNSKKDDLLI